MPLVKDISIKVFSWVFCAFFLISCHSNNNVVSSYGKRKYTRGWFLFRHGEVKSDAAKSKDSAITHNYTATSRKPIPAFLWCRQGSLSLSIKNTSATIRIAAK